jgi:hypothetical protein
VDLDATEMAMKCQLARTRQKWISKHTTGFCAVGKMMLHVNARSGLTPNVQNARLQKRVPPTISGNALIKRPTLWEKSLKQLKYWMLTQLNPIVLAQIICERLSAWIYNNEPTIIEVSRCRLV